MRSYCSNYIQNKSACAAQIGVLLFFFFFLPAIGFAASLSFVPSSGTYIEGNPLSVSVYVSSGGTAVNAASGVVSFPTNLLEVTSISKNQSIVSLWVQEPTFSNSMGTVNFEGIMLNPGFTGNSGKIATINFRIKEQGEAPLSFSSGSILANDGLGTDILSTMGSAVFMLQIPTVEPPVSNLQDPVASELTQKLPERPQISSQQFKTPETWTSTTSGIFHFEITPDILSMRLLVDEIPNSVPTVVYEPPQRERKIDELQEGLSYLHAQYKNDYGWGEINHYRLKIDTQKPTDLSIKEVAKADVLEDSASFLFEASDAQSGISHYEVQIDDSPNQILKADKNNTYTTARLTAGTHTLRVKAFDMAGNFVETSLVFVIYAPELESTAPTSQNFLKDSSLLKTSENLVTLLSIVIPFIALIVLLSLLLYFLWKLFGGLKKRIDKEVLEAKMIVHKAFAILRDDLEDDIALLEKASTKRKLTKEEKKILKCLRKDIEDAEKVISKEIADIEKEVRR